MDHIIAIIGYSGSGKTTVIANLVPELKRRGYRVGTIKHTHHQPEFDKIGKDSWRHFDSGADTAMIYSKTMFAMIRRQQPSAGSAPDFQALAPYFADLDIVIAEGFKTSDGPKIEVYRGADGSAPLCLSLESVIAVISDAEIEVPVRRLGFDQTAELADMIEQAVLIR